MSINSTPWNCDYDERLRCAFQIAHSAFKIELKHALDRYKRERERERERESERKREGLR